MSPKSEIVDSHGYASCSHSGTCLVSSKYNSSELFEIVDYSQLLFWCRFNGNISQPCDPHRHKIPSSFLPTVCFCFHITIIPFCVNVVLQDVSGYHYLSRFLSNGCEIYSAQCVKSQFVPLQPSLKRQSFHWRPLTEHRLALPQGFGSSNRVASFTGVALWSAPRLTSLSEDRSGRGGFLLWRREFATAINVSQGYLYSCLPWCILEGKSVTILLWFHVIGHHSDFNKCFTYSRYPFWLQFWRMGTQKIPIFLLNVP